MRFKRHDRNGGDWLAEQFAGRRPHLQPVAYRTLRSVSDSEDAVQEAWIRPRNTDATVANLGD